jgi:hypothetical protein
MTVYLHLFHGRNTVDEELDDWGFDGGVLGPFKYLHMTYCSDLKFSMEESAYRAIFPDDTKATAYEGFIEGHFETTEGLIIHQAKYYGDFSICTRDVFEQDKLLKPEVTA